jgi:hypothetical protein
VIFDNLALFWVCPKGKTWWIKFHCCFFHHSLCNILHFSRMVKKYCVRAWGLHFMVDNFQISPKSWHRNGRWPLGAWQWRRMAAESSTVMVRNTSYKSVITSFLWNDKPM